MEDVDRIAISTTESNNDRNHKFVSQNTASLFKRKRTIEIRSRLAKIDSWKRLAWNNTGPKQLEHAEMKVFELLKSHFDGRYISVSNNTQQIWTISANLTSENIPLVLIHGFAGGVGLWSLNLDDLCSNRPVYAIDLPGFARSSRSSFSLDPKEAEKQFIELLEEWRIEIGLNQEFILLGHSFGGFLSASYALTYPKYVKQLVLIDPWGFSEKPEDIWQTIPIWLRSCSSVMMKLSPLAGLRAAGPLGVPVVKYFRSDMRMKFKALYDDDRIFAFFSEPMINRIHLLHEKIPIYFLHGEKILDYY